MRWARYGLSTFVSCIAFLHRPTRRDRLAEEHTGKDDSAIDRFEKTEWSTAERAAAEVCPREYEPTQPGRRP